MNARHVVSLELAKRLKEVGFPQETEFEWRFVLMGEAWAVLHSNPAGRHERDCAAPLASEVAEQLFSEGALGTISRSKLLNEWWASGGEWSVKKQKYLHVATGPTMPDALAALWLALKEAQR